MEAGPASEAFCFFCASDVGHTPKEELPWRSVSVCLFALKFSTTICDVCSVVSDPYHWSAVFLDKYWKQWENKPVKDALQCLHYKIQPPFTRLFLFTYYGPGIDSTSNRNRVHLGGGAMPRTEKFTIWEFLPPGILRSWPGLYRHLFTVALE